MLRRVLSPCLVLGCCLLPCLAEAQTGSPAYHQRSAAYYHDDEHDPAPAPGKAIDEALADLMRKLAGVKLKTGSLDLEGLKKALDDKLRGLKPPDKLKTTSAAVCYLADVQDTSGYWVASDVLFTKVSADQQTWQTKLNVDGQKFALSGPPVAELKYIVASHRLGGPSQKPFGKDARVLADYDMNVTVSVTFDARSVADGTGGTFSGVGAGAPDPCTFTSTVSLADRTRFVPEASR